ncbi:hypothetical protein J6590_095526 [Homalodisca vitripennis]|nr:hypothetical protein J6590_095526 [Homalodisca vitripennis]
MIGLSNALEKSKNKAVVKFPSSNWSITPLTKLMMAVVVDLPEKLGMFPGNECIVVMKSLDELRVKKAEKAMQEMEKKCRKQLALAKKRLEETYEESWRTQTIQHMELKCIDSLHFKQRDH